ncbi:hypothetical protein D3C81_1457960 [compost metagenome]
MDCTKTKMMADRAVAPRRLRICGDPHSYSVPAHEKASRRGTIVVVMKREPR